MVADGTAMKLTQLLALIPVIAVIGCGGGEDAPRSGPLQVCDVLDQVERLHGKTIIVEGIVSGGHGYALSDCRPAVCASPPESVHHPGSLVLLTTDSLQVQRDGVPSFETDESFGRMMKTMRKDKASQAIVVLEGEIRRHRDDWFGQLSLFPGMLVVKSVKLMKPIQYLPRRADYCDE
jgi:hypothetical protein